LLREFSGSLPDCRHTSLANRNFENTAIPLKTMKMTDRIKKRLRKDRVMTTISMRLPEDVIEDLKEVAPALGFSGYQPLIRAYIGQGSA